MSLSVEAQMRQIRSYVMRGEWQEVCEMFKQERALRTAPIMGTGDTMLHIAVSSSKEHVAANMVDLLFREEDERGPRNNVVVTVDREGEESSNANIVLGVENNKKNTPLHLAAIMGKVEICKKIGGKNPSLIAGRNIAGETPLLLAALYGRKEAFLWLHYLYMGSLGATSTNFAHCIRNNDDTILHCAIAEGHFDVAIEIIHLYKYHLKEMMMRNKEGLSPLHLLASKPSAFKSTGVRGLPTLVRPIYWILKVQERNQATTFEELQKYNQANILAIKFMDIMMFLLSYFEAGKWLQMRKVKEEHLWSLQLMNELLHHACDGDMLQITSGPTSEQLSISQQKELDNESEFCTITIEAPLLIAAKNGIREMVEKIVELFPSRIEDVNIDGKNILLLAIEYRQVEVFDFLNKQEWLRESLLEQVDNDGNNALHLIARPKVEFDWPNPKRTLSMSTELTWFEGERYNRKMETPDDIFRENHTELMKNEAEWVGKTSQACSVVSTLVVSVAFATRTDVPGGFDDKGYAILKNKSGFKHFANSSFAALFFSLISTIFFLSIVASPSGALLWSYVSFKFYIGISFMFLSIVCLSISFCAADFFMLDDDSLQAMHYSPKNHMLLSLIIALLVVVELPTFLRPIFPEISPFPSYRGMSTLPIEYRRTENKENSRELRHQN